MKIIAIILLGLLIGCSAASFKENYTQTPAKATAEMSVTSQGRHTFSYNYSAPTANKTAPVTQKQFVIVVDGKQYQSERRADGKIYLLREIK